MEPLASRLQNFLMTTRMYLSFSLVIWRHEDRTFNYRLSRARWVIGIWHSVKPLPHVDDNVAAPPIHRPEYRKGIHCFQQLEDDGVSNTASPAARPCRKCQQRPHHKSVKAGQKPTRHLCRVHFQHLGKKQRNLIKHCANFKKCHYKTGWCRRDVIEASLIV